MRLFDEGEPDPAEADLVRGLRDPVLNLVYGPAEALDRCAIAWTAT